MKKVILIFFLGLVFLSCNDDNEANSNFSTESLKQTQWSGTMVESYTSSTGEPVSSTIKVGIFFISDSGGRSSFKWEIIAQPTEDTFDYTIEGKVLTFKNGTRLNGDWLLIRFDKEEMILEKGSGGEDAYKGVLTLTRVN